MGADNTQIKENQISDLEHNATKLQGRAISTDTPSADDVLTWDNTNSQWIPASGSGGGDVEIQENDSQIVSAASVINFEGDISVTDEGSGKATVTVSGSGGGGTTPDYSYWNPLAPPDSPSSYDDEFDDSSIDIGKWTEYDQSNILTITEEEYGLRMEKNISGTQEIGGIYQTAPAFGFTVQTRVAIQGDTINDTKAGIWLAEDISGNPTTCDHYYWVLYLGSSDTGIQAEYFTDYNTHSAGDVNKTNSFPVPSHAWLRIRTADEGEGTYSVKLDYSTDGLSWAEIYSAQREFIPSEVGLMMRSSAFGAVAVFSHFRITTGDDASEAYEPAVLGNRTDGWFSS